MTRKFTRAEALFDISQLLQILTEAHPDPFMNIGSQVKFYIKVNEILSNLPETLNMTQLHIIACKITALLGDGHTFMDEIYCPIGGIWLELEPIDEKLIVMGVYESKHSDLIGNILLAVNGVSTKDLLSIILEIRGANGIYNNLIHLADALKNQCMVSFRTGNASHDADQVILTLMSQEDNSIRRIIVPYGREPPGELIERNSLHLPLSSESDVSYKILENRIGYLRIDSMRRYRENYESQLKDGASESFLRELLERSGINSNGKIEEIISGIPSASETIITLLQEMSGKGIKDIVVDLRKNTGGNSYLAYILAYFLYGNRALEMDEGCDIKKSSTWYQKQFNVKNNTEFPGGYNFQELNKWSTGKRGLNHEEWEEIVGLSSTFAKYVKGYNPPTGISVYTLCSARTFSAGFDLLSILKKCGATVIGIKSSQAANAFTHTIRFSLDLSGLKGWVSSKLMLKFPEEPIFYNLDPDISIGTENFKKRRWDSDTILMEAIDLILSKR
jgi:hypothetical protein